MSRNKKIYIYIFIGFCVFLASVYYYFHSENEKERIAVKALSERGKCDLTYDSPSWAKTFPEFLKETLGKTVTEIYMQYPSDEDLKLLENLTNLEKLTVLEGLEPLDLSLLRNVVTLKKLSIRDAKTQDLTSLKSLSNLKELSLSRMPVTDLSPLNVSTKLEKLALEQMPITDLSSLKSSSSLQTLLLVNTSKLDFGTLVEINMKNLAIWNTPIKNIAVLSKLINLKQLDLIKTEITKDQIEILQERLPNCKINFTPKSTLFKD
jgi:Leucine-rich repeat (LRR) protein